MNDWLSIVVKTLFFMIVMTLGMRWLGRSRLRPRPALEARRLVHTPAMLAVGVAGVILFAAVAVASMAWPDPQAPVLAAVVLSSFVLLPGTLVADYYRGRHTVSDEGMDAGRLLGKRRQFRWSEVKRVSFGSMLQCFRLELESGEVLRVSTALMGLPAFASCVLRHVPAVRIDKATALLLEKTAQGELPRLG